MGRKRTFAVAARARRRIPAQGRDDGRVSSRHAESVLPMCPRHIVMPDLMRHPPCSLFGRWSGSPVSIFSPEPPTARSILAWPRTLSAAFLNIEKSRPRVSPSGTASSGWCGLSSMKRWRALSCARNGSSAGRGLGNTIWFTPLTRRGAILQRILGFLRCR